MVLGFSSSVIEPFTLPHFFLSGYIDPRKFVF